MFWSCVPSRIPQVLSQEDKDTQLDAPRLPSLALLLPLEARSCCPLSNTEVSQPNELAEPLSVTGWGTPALSWHGQGFSHRDMMHAGLGMGSGICQHRKKVL